MSGSDAWSIIAPVLGQLVNAEGENAIFTKAYVTTFMALKEYDQSRGNEFKLEGDLNK